MELSKSYRSTVEILELAAAVSGEKTINCISRQGRKPMWYAAVDEEQMYTKLVRSLNEMTDVDTAAVLCSGSGNGRKCERGIKGTDASNGDFTAHERYKEF